jgi:hypothetical protein
MPKSLCPCFDGQSTLSASSQSTPTSKFPPPASTSIWKLSSNPQTLNSICGVNFSLISILPSLFNFSIPSIRQRQGRKREDAYLESYIPCLIGRTLGVGPCSTILRGQGIGARSLTAWREGALEVMPSRKATSTPMASAALRRWMASS